MKWPWSKTNERKKLDAIGKARAWERDSRSYLSQMVSVMEEVDKHAGMLVRLEDRLQKLQESIQGALEESKAILVKVESHGLQGESLERQHASAMEALRNELTVATESTIPTLVAANQLHLERYRAETAVQVMRQVAVSGDREDRE